MVIYKQAPFLIKDPIKKKNNLLIVRKASCYVTLATR